MARLLTCPHCQAQFALQEWARKAACPSCGQRVSFFDLAPVEGAAEEGAAGAAPEGAPPAAPSGPDGTPPAVPVGPPWPPVGVPPERSERTIFGKPRGWTRGWTVVVAIWAVCAVLLLVARVGMGHVPIWAPEELVAIDLVLAQPLDEETTYREALDLAQRRVEYPDVRPEEAAPPLETLGWWAIERPWEGRTYVVCVLPVPGETAPILLGWWVEDGVVMADPATETFLKAAADGDSMTWPDPPAFLR